MGFVLWCLECAIIFVFVLDSSGVLTMLARQGYKIIELSIELLDFLFDEMTQS